MLLLLGVALAAPPAAPLFDVTAVGLAGIGGSTDGSEVFGSLLRAGGGLTGWVVPRVGLGVRVDAGSYAASDDDDPNVFVFAEGRYRATDRLSLLAGVGTPVIWVEYYCVRAPCPQGPWEYHSPIGAVAASVDLSRGALLVEPALRGEVGGSRWGVGVDLSLGVRARRRE